MGLFSEYRIVNRLLNQKHAIVFYAESRHYYQYFEKLLSDIIKDTDLPVCYITSDKKDPLLSQANSRVQTVYCKWLLGFLFKQITADVMIMTMPDLDNFFLKRSPKVKQYVYVFHAAVSTHLQYRKSAFDNYDFVFCNGPYQEKEIRKAEELYKLPAKQLVPYGYPLITKLQKAVFAKEKSPTPKILIAPSWFSGCIFETCIEELLEQLAKLSYPVLVRSHPEYEKRYPARFKKIKQMISTYPQMAIDNNPDVLQSLLNSEILITDRSGIAFEFAFGTGKPVLFIDTALKQTNADWKEISIEPVEISYRSLMGVSVLPNQLNLLADKIDELKKLSGDFSDRIKSAENSLFYNDESYHRKAISLIKTMAGTN